MVFSSLIAAIESIDTLTERGGRVRASNWNWLEPEKAGKAQKAAWGLQLEQVPLMRLTDADASEQLKCQQLTKVNQLANCQLVLVVVHL